MEDIDPNALILEEFKLDTLRKDENGDFLNPRIVMIAPSGSGKSWIVRNVLYCLRDIPCGTIIAPTDKMTKFYDDFIPSSYIYHEYKDSIIPKINKLELKIINLSSLKKKDNHNERKQRKISLSIINDNFTVRENDNI